MFVKAVSPRLSGKVEELCLQSAVLVNILCIAWFPLCLSVRSGVDWCEVTRRLPQNCTAEQRWVSAQKKIAQPNVPLL